MNAGVKHWMGVKSLLLTFNQTQNTVVLIKRSQCLGAKLQGQKGNIPDLRLRSLNNCLVCKEVVVHKQPGGRLRSSHP